MGIKQKCILCEEQTHRQVKRVPMCKACKDLVHTERERMRSEMHDKIKDPEMLKDFNKFINTRTAIGNLVNKITEDLKDEK